MPKKFSVIDKFNQSIETVKEDPWFYQDSDWVHEGLCDFFSDTDVPDKVEELFHLFEPSDEEIHKLVDEHKSTMYWGSESVHNCSYKLTGLRLTILFFIATINKEL